MSEAFWSFRKCFIELDIFESFAANLVTLIRREIKITDKYDDVNQTDNI